MEEDLSNLSKEELMAQIKKLKCHVKQLRNVIAHSSDDSIGVTIKKPKKNSRPFDFSGHSKRHVALKVSYVGWDFQGLVVQEDCNNTVEDHLFKALLLTKLVQDRTTSNYHRCGRTDKGVSAFSQVFSLDVRSNGEGKEELNYCKLLNRVLPKEIRVLAWASVPDSFSARFDCIRRTYKYFLPKADLNVQQMREGGKYLEGTHDFRNFCKSDGTKSTVRKIFSVTVEDDEGDGLVTVVVVGQSFVWHQIRCIVSILILIGVGKEKPEVVQQLLDSDDPKPNYGMAVDYPLVLFQTEYENVQWINDPENLKHVCKDLKSLWTEEAVKAKMLMAMIKGVGNLHKGTAEEMMLGTKTKNYKPLVVPKNKN